MSASNYYNVDDIKRLCFVGRSRAYQIIAQLNAELESAGYLIPKRGQVPQSYANKRLGIKEA